jgi:hypothetical protein
MAPLTENRGVGGSSPPLAISPLPLPRVESKLVPSDPSSSPVTRIAKALSITRTELMRQVERKRQRGLAVQAEARRRAKGILGCVSRRAGTSVARRSPISSQNLLHLA